MFADCPPGSVPSGRAAIGPTLGFRGHHLKLPFESLLQGSEAFPRRRQQALQRSTRICYSPVHALESIFPLTNRTRLPSGRHIKLMNLFHLNLGFRIHLCPANQLLAKINREKVWQQTDHSKPNQRQPNTHARQAKAAPNHVEPQQGQASEAASGPSKPRPTPPSKKTIKRNKRALFVTHGSGHVLTKKPPPHPWGSVFDKFCYSVITT